MSKEPLSSSIVRAVNLSSVDGELTLNRLLKHTGGRGIQLVIILLCLPFITPVPLPGVSTVVGVILLVLSVRQALQLPPRLPKFIGDRPFRIQQQARIMKASLRFLGFIEKIVRSRGKEWLDNPVAHLANHAIVGLLAILLILPFPPFVFFTNSLPSCAIILIAASMMEGDAILVWFGYLMAVLAIAYLAFIIGGSTALVIKYWQTILDFVSSLP